MGDTHGAVVVKAGEQVDQGDLGLFTVLQHGAQGLLHHVVLLQLPLTIRVSVAVFKF